MTSLGLEICLKVTLQTCVVENFASADPGGRTPIGVSGNIVCKLISRKKKSENLKNVTRRYEKYVGIIAIS